MTPLLRQLGGRTAARAMPEVLLLLFAVSQLSAIVDFGRVAREVQAASFFQRTGVAGVLVLLSAWRGRGVARLADRVPWYWALPHVPRRVGLEFGVLAAIATLPMASVATCLGPAGFVGVWVGAVAMVLLQHRPLACLGMGAAATLLVGVNGLLVVGGVAALRWFGESVRAGRRLGGSPSRSLFFAAGPFTARVNRDLLALVRSQPARSLLQVVVPGALAGAFQFALLPQWSPSGVTSGAVLFATVTGVLPSVILEQQSRVLGRGWLPRSEAIGPAVATVALYTSGALPVAAVWGAQIVVGVGGPVGGLRLLVLHSFFVVFAAWNLVRRSVASRRHALGQAVFIAVFCGLGNWALGSAAAVLTALLTLPLFLDTMRRIR